MNGVPRVRNTVAGQVLGGCAPTAHSTVTLWEASAGQSKETIDEKEVPRDDD